MAKVYSPKDMEDRIYKMWEDSGAFKPKMVKGKKPFTIVMPPPNITGQLHVGHALDEMPQDVLIRYHRMKGDPTLWLPGTDHAAIATEVKVVDALKSEGLTKQDLGRDMFLDRVWNWKKEYGGRIVKQLRKLGVSCDWSRERFTMDEGLSKAVRETFCRLYEKGLIYRGLRMINWCPACKSALSDAEVEYVETPSFLWHLRYPGPDGRDIVVATTRPETMLGDTAVCVNPKDERYTDIVGKYVTLPIVNRQIPIVADDYAEMEFGTGAVKMTPAHDPNDYEVAKRHDLDILCVIDEAGCMNENAGEYAGMTREECRKVLVKRLKEEGYLVKEEPFTHNVGTCYRHHIAVEPYLSKQWFVKMPPLAAPAIDVVKNGELKIIPERFEKTYLNWMENIRDWCISRQLWWGHRIPAFYCDTCGEMTISREDITVCPKCGAPVRQDEDVLDTWFSSALWPFSTLGWPEETEDFKYFYPNSVLSCGYDIIFFWLARMVFSGLEQTGKCPFEVALMHGLVRDAQGRKMSKSLGNGIDPLEVIEKYGADALRFSLEIGVAPGADVRMSVEKIETYRNFANKIWNASRFALMNMQDFVPEGIPSEDRLALSDKWILTRYNEQVRNLTDKLESFDLGMGAYSLYDFIWSYFCDWYIEMAKHELNGDDAQARKATQEVLYYVLTGILKLLHPYMPFITEELYSYLPGHEGMLINASWPVADEKYDFTAEADKMDAIMDVIRAARNLRAEMKVAASKKATLIIRASEDMEAAFRQSEGYLYRLASASDVKYLTKNDANPEASVSAMAGGSTLFIPMGELVDVEKELARLGKELEATKAEISRGEGKLSNPGFISKAPAQLVEAEKQKIEKNKALMQTIMERIEELKAIKQ
ncbi:MAG: valine--tRNA ligase [Clostridia bacterium]|nr:valine--tRNA ligase [Clostridia bacterium]